MKYSVVIPAYNEEGAIDSVIPAIMALKLPSIVEIALVDDCSTDGTKAAIQRHIDFKVRPGTHEVTLHHNVQNFGYGYSLKKGIAAAKGDHIVILDADGSYPIAELPRLITEYERGHDMVVGARQGSQYHGSIFKRLARYAFRWISEFATGRHIPDINSGYRIFRKDTAMKFFHTLSSGFSFTTTITLAYMLNHYSVKYVPVPYHKRHGRSKVKYVRDTMRSAQIIIEAITFYNPLKLFLLCALGILISGALSIILAYFVSVGLAFLVFFILAFAIIVFALGLIATFLKFSHNGRHE